MEERAIVPVERYIEQVTDGVKYKGILELGGIKFEWTVTFEPHLTSIDAAKLTSVEAMRRTVQISVKKDDVLLELTDDEYGFFLEMVGFRCAEFHGLPSTRVSNECGVGGIATSGKGPMTMVVAGKVIAEKYQGDYNLPAEAREGLSQPKFGCDFAAD